MRLISTRWILTGISDETKDGTYLNRGMPSFFAHTATFFGLPHFFLPQFLQSSAKFLLISAPVNNLGTIAQYTPLFSILLKIWLMAHGQGTILPEKISSEENDKENHTRAELQHTFENNAATSKLQLFHTGHRKTIVGGRRHFSENFFFCGFTEIIEKIARKSLEKNLAEI